MNRLRRHPRPGAAAKARTVEGLANWSRRVVYPHVFDNADREVGGVLVGRIPRGGGLPLVTGAIEALEADEQRATLTFTQEAWSHVHRVLDTEFPDGDQIVGWYHSHPGFGIFLSGHDMFIHENFFSGESQIALVVDPHARVEGVFRWEEGKVVPLYDDRPTPEGWEAKGVPPRPPVGDSPADRRSVPAAGRAEPPLSPVIALAIAACVGVLIWLAIRPTEDPAPARPSGATTPEVQPHVPPTAEGGTEVPGAEELPEAESDPPPEPTTPAPAPAPAPIPEDSPQGGDRPGGFD